MPQIGKNAHPRLRPDVREIRRFLSLIAAPDQVFELRLLKVLRGEERAPVTKSGFFNDYDKLAENAVKYSTAAQGAYITLNPVKPDLLARAANRLLVAGRDDRLTGDADITVQRWLPVDLDPVRPSGISSTDEEHGWAIERAKQIKEALRDKGWPDPIVGDSGNGGHVLYRVDLPTYEGLIQRCLQALALKFDDDRVKVDQAVFNPARIWKLYGTISRKGDDVAERPHRLARILEVP
jgi:hypothetical protein